MKIGDAIRPEEQTLDAGGLARLYKCLPVADPSLLQTFGGPSPMVSHLISVANAPLVLGIEGGFGISISNAEDYWGKAGTLLRKKIRIDKCPWPDGQQDIRIRCTINYAQTTGGLPATSTATPNVVTLRWNRNTTKIFALVSGVTPDNAIQEAFGYHPGSCSVLCKLEAHGVGVGQPLVQDDGDPYTETFVTMDVTNPQFSNNASFFYTPNTRHHMLPCPQWSIHHINFPGGPDGYFLAADFSGGAIGLVMSVDWEVEAVGWDTGTDDDLDAQGFELPDVDGSPFNAGIGP